MSETERWPIAWEPVIRQLEDSLTAEGIEQWLDARNRYLRGKRPRDLLEQRRYETVLAAAEAFADGVYL